MKARREPLLELLGGQTASVGTVELLMLLRGGPADPRPLAEICGALGCPSAWAELQLHALAQAGLVQGTAEAGYAYAPATPDRASAVEALAREWHRDRVRVSRRIFSR